MSRDQQTAIQELKSAAGWINRYTPPNGYVLDDKRYANISMTLISVVHRHIIQTKTATAAHPMVPLTLHLYTLYITHLSLILIIVKLELRLGDEVPVLLTNLKIIQ